MLETGERLASSAAVPTDIGIAVQPLTSTLAAALAARRGVVVSEVHAGGPANGKLEPGDVITGVDDWSTDNPDELLLRLASHAAGDTVTITTLRAGATLTTTVALEPATVRTSATTLAFVVERGVGTRVEAGGDVSVPGLEPGDTITRAGATMAPTPAQVRRALTQPTPTGLAVLIVRRDGRQRIIAVPVTLRGHAASR